MTLPAFRAAGTGVGSTMTITPGLPAGTAENDILLLVVESTSTEAVTAPTDYVAVADSPQSSGSAGAGTRLSVFWRRASASEVAPTVPDTGDHMIGQIFGFSGCITTGDPWDVTAGNVADPASASVAIPGDTTTVADCLIVGIVSTGEDITSTTNISGWANADLANVTERGDFWLPSGNGGGFGVATGEKATAGAFGATTATLVTSFIQARLAIALKPPAAGGAATVTPATIAVVVTLPTPTISVGAIATPAVIAVVVALPTPTVLAGATVTPAVIPLVVTLPTPTIDVAGGATTVTPAVIAVVASLPTPAILAGAKVTPAVIPLAALLPTPTVVAGAAGVATPAVIAVTVGLPTPSISIGAVVTPAGIALVVTVPTPTVTTPGLVTPAGISLVVTLPTPGVTIGAVTFWEKDPVLFVKVGPGDDPPWN